MTTAVKAVSTSTSSTSPAFIVMSVANASDADTTTSCWTAATGPPPRRICTASAIGTTTPNKMPQPASSILNDSHSGPGAIAVTRSMTPKPTTSDASNPAAAVTRNGTTASLGSAIGVGTPTRLDPARRGVAASMARDDHRPTLPGRLAADNRPWLGVHPGRVGDADDRPLGREEPDDRLAPRLLTHRVQELVAGADELVGCGLHAGHVGDVELD